nr:MAG: hypothetical protein TU36_05125 [Vulcanisaeta sp. AZ3]
MPSIRTLAIIASLLLLAILLIYLAHSLLQGGSLYVNSTLVAKYNELLNNYTSLMTRYEALQQKLNECLSYKQAQQSQGILRHSEVITNNLVMNSSLTVSECNGYTMQGVRKLTLETKGPGYLLITYRLSDPQVISGQVSYYVYLMAQALPSMPITATYTYEGNTYAYAAGQYGQLVVPVLPNATYAVNLGFICYITTYYPPTNAGAIINGEIPEYAVVNVTYIW